MHAGPAVRAPSDEWSFKMILQIIRDTPVWVFAVLLVIGYLGYSQSKPRTVKRTRIYVLPCLMVLLSIHGVTSAFGLTALAGTAWLLGVVVAFWPSFTLLSPRGVVYHEDTRSFSFPGSWLPLGLFGVVFCIKYSIGGMLAHHYPMVETPQFVAVASFLYGCCTGVFFARAQSIWRAARLSVAKAPAKPQGAV